MTLRILSSLTVALLAAVSLPVLAQVAPPNQQASAPAKPIMDISPPVSVRVKDVVNFRGARFNQLQGFGLVSGLDGTGDSANAIPYMRRAMVNMLERFGMPQMPEGAMRPKNVASVFVTVNIPPFAKPGQLIDVTISSAGDAKSLQNGYLIQTPLRGADGRIYAVAQGPISLGGFGFGTDTGAQITKNAPTVGRIPNGAIVEKEIPVTLMDENGYIEAYLNNPDFTTATELADKINKNLLGNAKATDASTVRVFVTSTYRNNVPELIARIENLTISPQNGAAKVILDERTGTIVIGQNVSIGPVSIAHGGLIVKIDAVTTVSQPNPLSQGTTETVTNKTISFEEHKGDTLVLVKGSTVGHLVKSLNSLGIPPRDLITVLQMIKVSGALNAHLEIQ
ncbi:MAG: flagellar basal body P-ring protein FlgI [Candidatus Sericytochromatia bacterium]